MAAHHGNHFTYFAYFLIGCVRTRVLIAHFRADPFNTPPGAIVGVPSIPDQARLPSRKMLLLAFAVPALRAGARGPTLTARATISMVDEKNVYAPKDAKGRTPKIPKGPLGGYAEPGGSQERGILGDKSKSRQIAKFEAAQDYLFFQGPAPKSAIQEDLPSFFSPVRAPTAVVEGRLPSNLRCILGSVQENFQYAIDNLKITPLRIGIGLAGIGAFTIIFLSLVLAPGSQSPFFFLDRFYPPAIAKKKVVDAEKARVKAEEDRKKAAAKAEAEAAKAAKAAPKK